MKVGKLFLLGLTCLSLVSCGPKLNDDSANDEQTVVITDMLNRKVSVKKNADSFVCVGPGALRQYCYVGDTSKIVAIESYEKTSAANTRPYIYSVPNYMELPVIGQGGPKNNINKEALVQINPDVVFTSYVDEPAEVDLLAKQTHLPVVALALNSNGLFAEDIYQSLKLIGQVTGRSKRAQEVVDYFENSKQELIDIANIKPSNTRAYLGCINHRGSHGIDFTTGDFPIFDILNVKNVVHEKGITDFKTIEKEWLIGLQPEMIIIDAGGLKILQEDMKTSPNFYKSLDAFKNNKVFVELPFVFYSANFEVALADAYYIASLVYPEQFKGFDIKTKFDQITNYLLGNDIYDKITERFGVYHQLDTSELFA